MRRVNYPHDRASPWQSSLVLCLDPKQNQTRAGTGRSRPSPGRLPCPLVLVARPSFGGSLTFLTHIAVLFSRVSYGAWVDVNAERDGLLHVRDMSQIFTPSAEQMVATRDSLRVRVKFVDPGTGKLGLSLVEVSFRPHQPLSPLHAIARYVFRVKHSLPRRKISALWQLRLIITPKC